MRAFVSAFFAISFVLSGAYGTDESTISATVSVRSLENIQAASAEKAKFVAKSVERIGAPDPHADVNSLSALEPIHEDELVKADELKADELVKADELKADELVKADELAVEPVAEPAAEVVAEALAEPIVSDFVEKVEEQQAEAVAEEKEEEKEVDDELSGLAGLIATFQKNRAGLEKLIANGAHNEEQLSNLRNLLAKVIEFSSSVIKEQSNVENSDPLHENQLVAFTSLAFLNEHTQVDELELNKLISEVDKVLLFDELKSFTAHFNHLKEWLDNEKPNPHEKQDGGQWGHEVNLRALLVHANKFRAHLEKFSREIDAVENNFKADELVLNQTKPIRKALDELVKAAAEISEHLAAEIEFVFLAEKYHTALATINKEQKAFKENKHSNEAQLAALITELEKTFESLAARIAKEFGENGVGAQAPFKKEINLLEGHAKDLPVKLARLEAENRFAFKTREYKELKKIIKAVMEEGDLDSVANDEAILNEGLAKLQKFDAEIPDAERVFNVVGKATLAQLGELEENFNTFKNKEVKQAIKQITNRLSYVGLKKKFDELNQQGNSAIEVLQSPVNLQIELKDEAKLLAKYQSSSDRVANGFKNRKYDLEESSTDSDVEAWRAKNTHIIDATEAKIEKQLIDVINAFIGFLDNQLGGIKGEQKELKAAGKEMMAKGKGEGFEANGEKLQQLLNSINHFDELIGRVLKKENNEVILKKLDEQKVNIEKMLRRHADYEKIRANVQRLAEISQEFPVLQEKIQQNGYQLEHLLLEPKQEGLDELTANLETAKDFLKKIEQEAEAEHSEMGTYQCYIDFMQKISDETATLAQQYNYLGELKEDFQILTKLDELGNKHNSGGIEFTVGENASGVESVVNKENEPEEQEGEADIWRTNLEGFKQALVNGLDELKAVQEKGPYATLAESNSAKRKRLLVGAFNNGLELTNVGLEKLGQIIAKIEREKHLISDLELKFETYNDRHNNVYREIDDVVHRPTEESVEKQRNGLKNSKNELDELNRDNAAGLEKEPRIALYQTHKTLLVKFDELAARLVIHEKKVEEAQEYLNWLNEDAANLARIHEFGAKFSVEINEPLQANFQKVNSLSSDFPESELEKRVAAASDLEIKLGKDIEKIENRLDELKTLAKSQPSPRREPSRSGKERKNQKHSMDKLAKIASDYRKKTEKAKKDAEAELKLRGFASAYKNEAENYRVSPSVDKIAKARALHNQSREVFSFMKQTEEKLENARNVHGVRKDLNRGKQLEAIGEELDENSAELKSLEAKHTQEAANNIQFKEDKVPVVNPDAKYGKLPAGLPKAKPASSLHSIPEHHDAHAAPTHGAHDAHATPAHGAHDAHAAPANDAHKPKGHEKHEAGHDLKHQKSVAKPPKPEHSGSPKGNGKARPSKPAAATTGTGH